MPYANKEEQRWAVRIWNAKHKSKRSARAKELYCLNKESIIARQMKRYWEKREEILKRQKEMLPFRRSGINRSVRLKRKTSPAFRILANLRCRMAEVIKRGGKSLSTIKMIGCSPEELRKHIESQFLPGMTWGNYGLSGWHIDHIQPCAWYDLSDPVQQANCFHYTNLQPLWALDNLRKSDKIAA